MTKFQEKMNNTYSVTPGYGNYNDGLVTSTPSVGVYTNSSEDYVSIFYKHVRRWRIRTLWSSSIHETLEDPSFKEIVKMGDKVVPLLIEEVQKQPDLLVAALKIITGEDPVPESDRGDFSAMARAWVEWHQHH